MSHQPVFVFVHEEAEGAAMLRKILACRVSTLVSSCESIVTANQDSALQQAGEIVEKSFRASEEMFVRFMIVSTPMFRQSNGSIANLGDYLNEFNAHVGGRLSACAVFSSQPGDVREIMTSQSQRFSDVEIFYFDPGWLAPYARLLENAIGEFVRGKKAKGT